MRNSDKSDNTVLSRAIESLRTRLPIGWRLSIDLREPRLRAFRPDAVVHVRAPDGTSGKLLLEVKARLTAQEAAAMAPRFAAAVEEARAGGGVVVTRFVGSIARERLRKSGISWLDSTGNVRIAIDRPALFIDAQGADRDPDPPERGIRSLKGPKAARLVRALVDWNPPVGVRELAARAETDPGYASRVLTLLEKEDVIRRGAKGDVAEVRWQDLLRRWAEDYGVTSSNRTVKCLAPRGITAFTSTLERYAGRWALTGSLAVPDAAAISPSRLVLCYVDYAERAIEKLDLRLADQGINVVLLEPFDPVVWQRIRTMKRLRCVALSQCVADLLTGTGREPAEAEALMKWMASNMGAWRA